MKIGLYFGSFNPIHIGHLIIADYMVEFTELEQVWFVVSPHNPHKKKESLLADYHRLAMVELAIEGNNNLKASNIEFNLPQPSYTIDTLVYIKEKYPKHQFSLIMGEDNLKTLHNWKNYEQIIEQHLIYVYPRNQIENNLHNEIKNCPNIKFCNAPMMDISASFIRNAIKSKKSVQYMLSNSVYTYIQQMNFYKK